MPVLDHQEIKRVDHTLIENKKATDPYAKSDIVKNVVLQKRVWAPSTVLATGVGVDSRRIYAILKQKSKHKFSWEVPETESFLRDSAKYSGLRAGAAVRKIRQKRCILKQMKLRALLRRNCLIFRDLSAQCGFRDLSALRGAGAGNGRRFTQF